MPNWCNNRLIVLGSKRQVQLLGKSTWATNLQAKYCELLQNSPARFASEFYTHSPPVRSVTGLSRKWPRLIFLLIYAVEKERALGMAKSKKGSLTHHSLTY